MKLNPTYGPYNEDKLISLIHILDPSLNNKINTQKYTDVGRRMKKYAELLIDIKGLYLKILNHD